MTDLVPYRVPSANQLEQFWQLANKLSRTEFAPKPMRGSPEAVLACVLTGFELGIGPMQSLRDVYLVNGRPSLSATLMVARVRAQGHRFRTLENSGDQATVQIHRKGEPSPEPPVTFTIEDAKRAKLVSKDIWQQYPARMLWARAASACCRRDCPEVMGGAVYTPEELESTNGQTDAVWGEPEVDRATGEVLDEAAPGGLAATHAAPVSPPAPPLPTHAQIDKLRTAKAAADLAATAPPAFQRALKNQWDTDEEWRRFWTSAGLLTWKAALTDALETVEQSEAGPPASDDAAGGDGAVREDRAPVATSRGDASPSAAPTSDGQQ
jgi:hypothetical protein